MNDIEVKAKKIIYNIAWAVEAWRERHGGRDPVILMPGEMLAVIKLGAPCILNEASGRGTLLGCRMDVAAYDRVYLGEEVVV